MRTLGDWVAREVDKLIADGKEKSISVLVTALESEVPLALAPQGLKPTLREMVRKHLKVTHHVPIERGEDRERVWRQIPLLTLDECVGVLASKLAAIDVDRLRVRMDARLWVETHPEAGITVETLLALAEASRGGDDGPSTDVA
jgi:hypothetical protein